METPSLRAGAALACLLCLSAPGSSQKKLSTLFTSGNAGSSGWGNFFDVKVTNEKGVSIVGLEVNTTDSTGGNQVIVDVYTCPTTYVGNDTNASVWMRAATATATTSALNTPTPVPLATPFALAAGKYGVAVYLTNYGPAYSNGTAANSAYANADLGLTLGLSRTALFGGNANTARVWNGSILYTTLANSSTLRTYGTGCAGSNGTPVLDQASASWADLGKTLFLGAMNLNTGGGIAAMVVGVSSTTWGAFPLPYDLTAIGMSGCSLRVSADLVLPYANFGGQGGQSFPVPSTPSLLGGLVFFQSIQPDAGINSLGLTVTNGVEVTIGQ